MAVLTTGNTFSNGNQVTASSLNNAVNDAEFAAGAVDNTSTQLSGTNPQQIIVKDLGISRGKIAIDAVGTDQLANDVVISTSGSITGAAGSFTTLAASGDVTFDTTTLKVDSTNNRVGIGTASPAVPLDVNGQARVVGNLLVGRDDTDPNGLLTVYGGGTGQSEGGEIHLRTAADFDTTYNHYFIDAYEDDLRIGRQGGADITLTSDGSVGIGTVSPEAKLQIKTSASEVEGISVLNAGSTSEIFKVIEDGSNGGYVDIRNSSNTSIIRLNSSSDSYFNGGNVGIGTSSPSAPLEVTSTTGGVILPRMTTTQKNAISSPSNGEMVYDTTDNKFYGYANGAWVALH